MPKQLQKEALDWLDRHVLQAPMWLYPDEVVSKLGIDAVDEVRNRQATLIAMLEDYLKAQQATGINGLHYKNLLLQIKKIREKYESGK